MEELIEFLDDIYLKEGSLEVRGISVVREKVKNQGEYQSVKKI